MKFTYQIKQVKNGQFALIKKHAENQFTVHYFESRAGANTAGAAWVNQQSQLWLEV